MSTRSRVVIALLGAVTAFSAAGEPEARRFGGVGFYNPRIMYLKYQPLVDYLGESTGEPWELVISPSYEAAVDDLCAGRLDVAYLGPLTYLRAHEACGAEPLARLETAGRRTFAAYLMVRTESPVRQVQDLAGRSVGFGAILSTASHLVPLGMLDDGGLDRGSYSCRYYRHHEEAARAVLVGDVDACGIRDTVGDRFVGRGLRTLAHSEPVPNYPLVGAPGLEREMARAIRVALIDRPRAEAAVAARIASWDHELAGGFALAAAGDFESVRRLAERIFGRDALWANPEELARRVGCRAP